MKAYRAPLVVGFMLALFLGSVGLAGYSVVLYYNWPIILFVLLVLAVPIVVRQLSAIAYLRAVLILVVLSSAGGWGGHWVRRLQCRNKCRSCEPILELVQKHYADHGRYPAKLTEMEGFALAQRNAGLRVGQGEFSNSGVVLYDINSHDALIYLDTNFVSCVVPVTKRLPMSITRLYVYSWTSDEPSWKYQKLIWFLDLREE